jgi:hypothetical protein
VILLSTFTALSLTNQSKGCGIWYRRITEIIDVEPPALSHKPVPHLHDSPAKFGQPSFNAILYGPKPPSRFPALSSSPKRKLDCLELEEDDVSQFKRVWFISKRRKLKNIAGPFLYSQNMDASVLDPTETQEVEEERAWQQLDELKSSLGTLHVDTLSRIEHLARILRNRKKYLPAEKLLRNTISAGEEFLIAEKPEILLAMLHSLMTVLVDQCKFGEADELWVQSIEMFQERLGSDFTKALREGFELAHPFQHSSGSEAPSLATISTSSKIIDMVSALSATVFLQPRDCGEVLIDEEDDLNITSTSKRYPNSLDGSYNHTRLIMTRPSVECAAFGSHGIGSLRNKSLQFAHDDDEDDFWNWTAVLGSDYRAFRAKGSVSTDFGSAFLYGSSEFSDMNSRENQRVESPILDENFRISEDSLDSSAHLQRPQMPVKMKRIYICICCRMLRIKVRFIFAPVDLTIPGNYY